MDTYYILLCEEAVELPEVFLVRFWIGRGLRTGQDVHNQTLLALQPLEEYARIDGGVLRWC